MKIGNVIMFKVITKSEETEYRSKVMEIDESTFCIDIPQNVNTLKSGSLPKGVSIIATYLTSEGNVFEFNTRVIGKKNSQFPMIELLYPDENSHKKIQRRQFVRVHVPVDIAIHCPNKTFEPFVTHTEDISAGGVAAFIPNTMKIQENQHVDVWTALLYNSGEFKYLKFSARVVRVLEREAYTHNVATIEFLDSNKKERQSLIRYCFEKQLQLRDKLL